MEFYANLHLLRHALLLDEGPIDGRPDELGGGDRHSIELTEACNESRKPQGPVGLLQVQWVSQRRNPCKLIYSI